MLTTRQLLEPLAHARTDEVVVTTMSVVRPWGRLSDSDLDFASADSAMGHAADLALGIALAQPARTVVCLNGDGSLLMSLGVLGTIVGSGVTNLVHFVVDNAGFEITGRQPLADGGGIDFAGMARAAGFARVHRFDEPESYANAVPSILAARGATFVHVLVEPGNEGPISRSEAEDARYLRTSLADWSRTLRRALA
jgi:sulfopyruvate decarboxylase subunit beta